MTPKYNECALLLFGCLGGWEGLKCVILVLLCPAAMYLGMRGMRKQFDRDTKRKEMDISG